jgi:20S proteasome subunit alpha 5
MSLQAAEDLALSTLKAVMEDKVSKTNVDIAEVAPHYHLFSEDEVQAVINRVAQQGSNDLASGSVVVEQS